MTRKVYGALGVIAIASTLRIATASAGPCAGEIADFRSSLSRDKNGEPTFIGTAPQSIGAQLEHQPTRESVERAKKQAQAQILMVVTKPKRSIWRVRRANAGMRSPKRSSGSTLIM